MANERTYPCLPCTELDPAVSFYEALGFVRTYHQLRPNPYAVVQREDLQLHLFGMKGFQPEQSYATAIVAVPDPDALYRTFAAGLRAKYGKLPVKGIPRVTRPRKRYDTVYGFSVVDLGGNWLRISALGAVESASEDVVTGKHVGLAGALAVAARLGDAKGDERQALRTLESALKRFADAPAPERAQALLYRAELAVRLGEEPLARASLALVQSLALSADERAHIEAELAQLGEVMASN